MKCPNCGFDVGDFPFCPKCGTSVQKEDLSTSLSDTGSIDNVAEEPHADYTTKKGESNNGKPTSDINENDDKDTKELTASLFEKVKSNKKILYGAAALLLVIIIAIASSSNSGSSSYSSSSSSSTSSAFTESDIEDMAVLALYRELMSAKDNIGRPLAQVYDIDSTRYSIGSINGNSSDGWVVKGTFSLYNDYGEYREKGRFTANITQYGSGSCDISID